MKTPEQALNVKQRLRHATQVDPAKTPQSRMAGAGPACDQGKLMSQSPHIGRTEHRLDMDLLEMLEVCQIGQIQLYKKGRMLYWQGDPVEQILVIREGAVKISSISSDGKTYTYSVIGPGGLAGAEAFLLGKNHETLAEALEDTLVFSILPGEFEHLLASNSRFSLIVMRKLAQDVHWLTGKVREFRFLDVQQRLMSNLMELAHEHGIVTEKGIRIDLDITHEEIGELVAANRTTITACLGELKRHGYLWKEGRNFVIIPPEHFEILDNLERAVVAGAEREAKRWAEEAVNKRVDPLKVVDALMGGMRKVDRLFVRDEVDVSDIILAAFAMKSALPVVEQEISRTGTRVGYLGTVVIGTVYGDIHDIGTTIVSMLLRARGFNVIDLGASVSAAGFVGAVRKYKPQILAMSSLMTTTAQEPLRVISALVEEGLRDKVKVIVGGSAITQKLSEEMGVDGYEPSAHLATELAWRLTHSNSYGQAR